MNKVRRLIRVLCALALIAIVALGVRLWQRGRPDYYLHKAQAAIAAEDLAEGRIYLRNFLERFPEHGEGHRAMAELCLAEAKAAGQPAAYGAHPEAIEHLARAVRFLPEDIELQKEFVALCLSRPSQRREESVEAAERIVQAEPDNADALFVLARAAVEAGNTQRADDLLKRLSGAEPGRVFETFALAATNAEAEKDRDRVRGVLAEAARHAAGLTVEQIRALGPQELAVLPVLLVAAVDAEHDAAQAIAAATNAVAAMEKLVAAHGELSLSLAEQASRMAAALASRGAAISKETTERIERLQARAIARGGAAPIVYLQSARAAFGRGDHEAGLTTLKQGLEEDAKRPAEQRKGGVELHLLAARQLIVRRQFAEAEEHVVFLMQNKSSAGWGKYFAGVMAVEEGKFKKARDALVEAEKALGPTLPVRYSLALAYLGLGQWNEALSYMETLHVGEQEIQEALSVLPSQAAGFKAGVHCNQARACLSVGDWNRAQPHLAALKGTPLEPSGEAMAIVALTNGGQASPAGARLADARRRFPRHLDLLKLELAHLEQTQKTDEARKLIEAFVAASPSDLAGQLLLCDWRTAHKEAQRAIEQLDELLKRQPTTDADRNAITQTRVRALLALGKKTEAIAAAVTIPPDAQTGSLFQAANEVAEGDYISSLESLAKSLEVTAVRDHAGPALFRSVAVLARHNPPDKLEARLSELLRQVPDEPYLMISIAAMRFQQGKFNAGMELLDAIKGVEPNNSLVRLFEAEQWLLQAKPERAMACIERVLQMEPENIPALLLAAQASLARGQHQAALVHAQRAAERNPRVPQASLLQAESLLRLDRRDQALTVLEGLTKTQPMFAGGYSRLISLHMADRRMDKALEVCRTGRKQLPKDRSLLATEIELLAVENRTDEAQKSAEEAAGAKPAFDVCLAAARGFSAAKQFGPARDWYRMAEAAADDREKAMARLLLGDLALRQSANDPDRKLLVEARGYFAAVLADDPNNLVAANNLAWLLATEFNLPDEAVQVIEQAFERVPARKLPTEAVHTGAVVYRRAKRLPDAERLLRTALDGNSNQPTLVLELASVLAEAQRREEAKATLERALKSGLPEKEAKQAAILLNQLKSGS